MSEIARALGEAGEDIDYQALYRAHRDEEGFAPALVDLCRDPGFERVALWMLKRFFESGGRLAADDVSRLLGAVDGLRGWEAQLLALQCLPYCPVAAADRVRVEAFLRTHLAGKNKSMVYPVDRGFENPRRSRRGFGISSRSGSGRKRTNAAAAARPGSTGARLASNDRSRRRFGGMRGGANPVTLARRCANISG